MKHKNKLSAFLGVSLLSTAAMTVQADPFAYRDKPFDQHAWITTHNAYEKINQNMKEIPQQLKDGVRGFMLDLYRDDKNTGQNQIKVCHKKLACYGPFSNHLKNEFIPFLRNNPSAVVTLFLETYVEREDLQAVFNTIPELADVSFNPKNFSTPQWPTLGEMAQNNNRLILMTDKRNVAGHYLVNGKVITVLFDQDWIVQNHWETLGMMASSIEKTHNWSCPTRWPHLPLTTATVAPSTGKQWGRLFLMNQFHPGTSTIPDSASYDNNLTYLMRRVEHCGVTPNFIGVNHYQSGDLKNYARALTEGGVYLWEGNNADKSQDAVCALPRGRQTHKLPAQGCENDEARSMTLSGIAKGTQIALFDHPDGKRSDDYAVVEVKRDIGLHEQVVVPSFQRDYNTSAYQSYTVRNNNLDGKVSRIEIGEPTQDLLPTAIGLFEGNNVTQNRVCTVPTHIDNRFKMKSNGFGCRNDEVRSGKIYRAKAGTIMEFYGHPEGSTKEGWTVVRVLKDINFPVAINSFDQSFTNHYIEVKHQGNKIDGKISYTTISAPTVSRVIPIPIGPQ